MAAPNFSNRTTGIAEIDRKLAAIGSSKEQRRIVRKAFTAGLKVGRDSIRTELKSAPISPQLRRALRTTIASSFKRNKRKGIHEARVGMGLGKRKASKRSGKSSGGVGIGKRNVHWFLLGTKTRTVRTIRKRRLKRARFSGQIRAIPIVANAGRKSASKMVQAIRRTALEEIEATLHKLN